MYEKLPSPENVLAIRLSGLADGEDLAAYNADLEALLKQPGKLGILVAFTGLSDMSAQAFAAGMKADMDFLRHYSRFGRVGFISDKQWPAAALGVLSPLMPMLELKSFPSAEAEAAMAWTADLPGETETPVEEAPETPAIRFLDTGRDDVIAWEMDGIPGKEEFPAIIEEINARLAGHSKVRMLARIRSLSGFNPGVLMQKGLFSMKMAAMDKVERYAIVGAPAWLASTVGAMNPLFSDIDMRNYPSEEESDAWAWIGVTPPDDQQERLEA